MTSRPGGVPLTAQLAGLKVLVVGAGPVAAGKLRGFVAARADVYVVAPEAVPDVRAAADAGELTWHARDFRAADLAGAVLAVAATGVQAVDDAVAAAARSRAMLCVRADGGGTAELAAAVRRGPLLLTVATGGAAPALARRLREELAERYDEAYGELAALLGELRDDDALRAALAPLPAAERARRWRAASAPDILALIRAGRIDRAKEVARSCLLSSSG